MSGKSLRGRDKVFEVYICSLNNEILYIGSGQFGRHKHCNSGTSHVFELNEIFFKEGDKILNVEVVKFFDSKEKSLDYEKKLIRLHKPIYNKVHNDDIRGSLANDSLNFKRKLLDLGNEVEMGKSNKEKYQNLVNEFTSLYNFKDVLSKSISIYSTDLYNSVDLHHMMQLSRFLRYGDKYLTDRHYCKVFYAAVKEVLGYDLKQCISRTL